MPEGITSDVTEFPVSLNQVLETLTSALEAYEPQANQAAQEMYGKVQVAEPIRHTINAFRSLVTHMKDEDN